jgi:hypothetical protein
VRGRKRWGGTETNRAAQVWDDSDSASSSSRGVGYLAADEESYAAAMAAALALTPAQRNEVTYPPLFLSYRAKGAPLVCRALFHLTPPQWPLNGPSIASVRKVASRARAKVSLRFSDQVFARALQGHVAANAALFKP